MVRIAKIFCLVILGLILLTVGAVVSFLVRGNAFYESKNINPGHCQRIATNHGSAEDIEIDRERGLALLSALDRRGLVQGKNPSGKILQLNLADTGAPPISALASEPEGFRPHGISLFTDDNGTQTLFVINHSGGIEERIEIFEKQSGQQLFNHIQTLTDPLITHPNDLVAVGRSKFYIANDSGATNSMERAGEMMVGLGLSPLVFYDGASFSVVMDDLRSSGGINADTEEGLLFVGETMGKAIRVYNLAGDGTLLDLVEVIELEGSVDNIDLDADGNLWIANHTNTLAFVQHIMEETALSPSQVQRVKNKDRQFDDIQTVLESDGSLLSASSVGARYEDILVVGSITEPFVLICSMDGTREVER